MAEELVYKPFSINKFRAQGLTTGGSRPSLFSVTWTDSTPSYKLGESLLVKATSLPTSNITPLAVNYGESHRDFVHLTIGLLLF